MAMRLAVLAVCVLSVTAVAMAAQLHGEPLRGGARGTVPQPRPTTDANGRQIGQAGYVDPMLGRTSDRIDLDPRSREEQQRDLKLAEQYAESERRFAEAERVRKAQEKKQREDEARAADERRRADAAAKAQAEKEAEAQRVAAAQAERARIAAEREAAAAAEQKQRDDLYRARADLAGRKQRGTASGAGGTRECAAQAGRCVDSWFCTTYKGTIVAAPGPSSGCKGNLACCKGADFKAAKEKKQKPHKPPIKAPNGPNRGGPRGCPSGGRCVQAAFCTKYGGQGRWGAQTGCKGSLVCCTGAKWSKAIKEKKEENARRAKSGKPIPPQVPKSKRRTRSGRF